MKMAGVIFFTKSIKPVGGGRQARGEVWGCTEHSKKTKITHGVAFFTGSVSDRVGVVKMGTGEGVRVACLVSTNKLSGMMIGW